MDSEARFRLVVEATPSAMVMIRPDGLIDMVNAQAERVLAIHDPSCSASRSRCWYQNASVGTIPN
jgi:PAS domain-containing protein